MNHRKGEATVKEKRSPRRGSFGLHCSFKQWCEWLSDVVLGPGTLEKGGYGLSRPGWEFRV